MAKSGAPALLFERLIDQDIYTPSESSPFRILTRRELRESVRREVEYLLNTRSPFPAFFLRTLEPAAFSYGVPDFFSLFYPFEGEMERKLCALLGTTIMSFEPRLKNVQANLLDYRKIRRSLRLEIVADLIVGNINEPISFEVILHHNAKGTAEVNENQ
jgi:type VI secretion system protein ImpF